MSGRGNCYDNAIVETVFKTIKSECVWRTAFRSREQAANIIGLYIEGFYNPQRRHSSLGYKSPPQPRTPSARPCVAASAQQVQRCPAGRLSCCSS